MESIVPLSSGIVFGFALDRGLVSLPYTISSQMEFSNFTMMRMFLGASAMSTLCVLLFDILGIQKRKVKERIGLGLGVFGGFGANIMGGCLLGAGMALAGACPGTVWPQLARCRSAQQAAVVAGGISGTILFGYMQKVIKGSVPRFQETKPDPLAEKPRLLTVMSVMMLACTVGAVAGFDYLFPWKQELGAVVGGNAAELPKGLWDPLHAGILVGALQIPAMLSSGSWFGQSSGWVYASDRVASVFDRNVEKNAPYLRKARYAQRPYWQFLSSIGAILGAYISVQTSTVPAENFAVADFSIGRAYLGGVLLLLGARLGAGCTSGHGLSGVATGSLGSMISVACMFAGGFVATQLV